MSTDTRVLRARSRELGAAILAAMLTVTLVASFAASAVWQQWRATEVEAAERARTQSSWVLTGALDWARLILREDARSGGPDHLGEPWAVGLEESRLSSFLAADANNNALQEGGEDAFLSGRIQDMQARFNVTSLVEGGKLSEPNVQAFKKLLAFLDLPTTQADTLAENLRFASDRNPGNLSGSQALLVPERVADLGAMGLPPAALSKLKPFITVLPVPTPININTAPAEVLSASAQGLDLDKSRRLVQARTKEPFKTLDDTAALLGETLGQLKEGRHSVTSRYFEVTGTLRLGDVSVEETALFERADMNNIRIIWRERRAVVAKPTESGPEGGKPGTASVKG